MSEKPLEEMKKICLICGYHTSQAINIYEPRNGPNIVELIQAKFKFQPIKEDKYLCFNCNNWLINWHSLKNLDNESGNQSGKSRSRINDSIPEEEIDDYSELNQSNNSSSKRMGFYFSKRILTSLHRIRKIRRKKFQSFCSLCGRQIYKKRTNWILTKYVKRSISLIKKFNKCKTCKKILRWKAKYSNALLKEQQRKLKKIQETKMHGTTNEFYFKTNLVNRNIQQQRPLIDGKVVAMLRRLGTTLTRESDCLLTETTTSKLKNNNNFKLPTENYTKDEILIDFNTAITEVLPFEINSKRSNSIDNEGEGDKKINFEAIYSKIPKCVTISVVQNSNN